MMELNETSSLYKVDWQQPTAAYFIQELSELLGNEGRFTEHELFNPSNYDAAYKIMPHTFKNIAVLAKGEYIESDCDIKNMLSNKNMRTLFPSMGDWDKLKKILMMDKQCIQEGFNFFSLGTMKIWKGTDPETGEYIDNIKDTEYMGKLSDFLSPENSITSLKTFNTFKKIETEQSGEIEAHLDAYARSIDHYRDSEKQSKEIVLPPPFVVKYFAKKFDKKYVLIGGHKRSATALQLGIEPIKVWLIDLTK